MLCLPRAVSNQVYYAATIICVTNYMLSQTRGARMPSKTFTDEERAAMKEAARERKTGKANGEADVLAKIAEMAKEDRGRAERIHAIVKASPPNLTPRTSYGMPAYAKDGKVVCFFQSAQKFKSRYATLGFSDRANLDQGAM